MIGLTQDIKQCMRSAIVLISLLTTIFQFFTLLIFLRAVPCSVLVGSRHNRSNCSAYIVHNYMTFCEVEHALVVITLNY